MLERKREKQQRYRNFSFSLGILTRQDFDLYYHGERYTSDQAQSYTCPFCGDMGFSYPFLNDSSQTVDLFNHLQQKHVDEQQSNEVICPICASMANGEPNLMTGDLLAHVANEHQHQQVQTPSTPGTTLSSYARQSSSNREYDLTGSSTRASFRRGPLRTPSRRGILGGRGGGTVSQHFSSDSSSANHGSDPIADLLTQLTNVRRLAASNNSSSSNSIHLQTLTRQQYERERLRANGRSTQNPPAQTTPSNVLSNVENDFFDSLFSSALVIEPPMPTNNSQQTWAQIVAQQQQPPPPPPAPAPPSPLTTTIDQQQSSALLTTKTSGIECEPSLLRKLCDESPSSSLSQSNNSQKRKNDFVQNLFLASLLSSFNDNDK